MSCGGKFVSYGGNFVSSGGSPARSDRPRQSPSHGPCGPYIHFTIAACLLKRIYERISASRARPRSSRSPTSPRNTEHKKNLRHNETLTHKMPPRIDTESFGDGCRCEAKSQCAGLLCGCSLDARAPALGVARHALRSEALLLRLLVERLSAAHLGVARSRAVRATVVLPPVLKACASDWRMAATFETRAA